MAKYVVDGTKGNFWVIMFGDTEIAQVQGPMSFAVASAACELFNRGDYFVDGWIFRAMLQRKDKQNV